MLLVTSGAEASRTKGVQQALTRLMKLKKPKATHLASSKYKGSNFNRGLSVLFAAVMADNPELVASLIRKGISYANTPRDLNGNSALYYAVRSENKKIIKMLIDIGADVNQLNYSGKSAFEVASPSIKKYIESL